MKNVNKEIKILSNTIENYFLLCEKITWALEAENTNKYGDDFIKQLKLMGKNLKDHSLNFYNNIKPSTVLIKKNLKELYENIDEIDEHIDDLDFIYFRLKNNENEKYINTLC